VREILTVPGVDSFTVEAVTSQANGDTFSKFVAQIVGVEGIGDESISDFMSNYNQKSIRNADTQPTLLAAQFLLFQYNEVIPILVQRTNNVSVDLMKSVLGYTDGIFDGQRIIDRTLSSRTETMKTADAILQKYSNVIITATFSTNQEGLESGQLIRIKDTTSSERNINRDFVIQSVKMTQMEWGENIYSCKCSSLLFGMLELLQQLLAANRKIKVDEDEVVNNIEDANDTVIIADVVAGVVDGELQVETMTVTDDVTSSVITPPFRWQASATNPLFWDLGSWN